MELEKSLFLSLSRTYSAYKGPGGLRGGCDDPKISTALKADAGFSGTAKPVPSDRWRAKPNQVEGMAVLQAGVGLFEAGGFFECAFFGGRQ